MSDLKITVLEGKYTFHTIPGDYRIACLRYGESWLVFEAGHKAILALMGEIDELRSKIDQAKEMLNKGLQYHEHDGHDMPKRWSRDALVILGMPLEEQHNGAFLVPKKPTP